MVAWVVIDRRHYRQAGRFAMLLLTPLFPLPHLSPLLPYSYGHSYTTATHQPLCNQSLTHSFYLDGGCTPLLDLPSRPRSLLNTQYPPQVLSFHILAHSFAHFCIFLRSPKNSTPLFSIVSALFAKNHLGWGTPKCPARSRGQAAVVLLGFRPILFTEGRIHRPSVRMYLS